MEEAGALQPLLSFGTGDLKVIGTGKTARPISCGLPDSSFVRSTAAEIYWNRSCAPALEASYWERQGLQQLLFLLRLRGRTQQPRMGLASHTLP